MTDHKIGTREEWLAERLELLKAEKDLTRRSDELAQWRQKLPWVRIDKEYRFETDEGTMSLADLFRGRSQLLIYHFMFGPEYTGGLPGMLCHRGRLQRLHCASRKPRCSNDRGLARPDRCAPGLQAPNGLDVQWASSLNSDFNYDFNTSFTEEQQRSGSVDYNYRTLSTISDSEAGSEGHQDRIEQALAQMSSRHERHRRPNLHS